MASTYLLSCVSQGDSVYITFGKKVYEVRSVFTYIVVLIKIVVYVGAYVFEYGAAPEPPSCILLHIHGIAQGIKLP